MFFGRLESLRFNCGNDAVISKIILHFHFHGFFLEIGLARHHSFAVLQEIIPLVHIRLGLYTGNRECVDVIFRFGTLLGERNGRESKKDQEKWENFFHLKKQGVDQLLIKTPLYRLMLHVHLIFGCTTFAKSANDELIYSLPITKANKKSRIGQQINGKY